MPVPLRHLPPWCRKSPKVAEVLPLLYLHGMSSGDFAPALEQALTNDRADQPAIARRRELLQQTPRPAPVDPKEALARAELHPS